MIKGVTPFPKHVYSMSITSNKRYNYFYRRLVSALASSHHEALSKKKGTEKFTTTIFKIKFSPLH